MADAFDLYRLAPLSAYGTSEGNGLRAECIRYDPHGEVFTGTVRNTTDQTVEQGHVEVHRSDGTELGPTPHAEFAAGKTKMVELSARSQTITGLRVHVDLGSSEHGGGSGQGSEGRDGGQRTEGCDAGKGSERSQGRAGGGRWRQARLPAGAGIGHN